VLSRRLAVKAALAGLVAAPVAAAPLLTVAHAADPLPADYPTAGCFNFTDPKDDSVSPTVVGVLTDSDLELLGVAVETTPTSLKAYASVAALTNDPTQLEPFDAHRFTLKFTFNGHIFSASGSDSALGTTAIRDGLAQTGEAAHTTQLGVDTPAITDPTADKGFVDSGLKVTFDYKNSWVVFDLPIADIEKYGGAKFTGDLPQIGVVAQTDEYAVGSAWDYAPDANDDGNPGGTWTVGDNKCFGGGATAGASKLLAYAGDTTVQYGDAARMAATVVDASGKPLAGAPVTFAIGKLQTTAKTNAKGLAQTTLSPTVSAGRYTLVTSTTVNGTKTSVKTPFVVTPETTLLRLTSAGGKVTATLTDDDKHAVAGQRISWNVNGKSAGTTKTDRSGRTILKHVAKGDRIKAVFKTVKGKYAGTTAAVKG
jgi:hypothetical protein